MLSCPLQNNTCEEQIAENIEGNTKYLLKYISITKVARKSEGVLDDWRLNYEMSCIKNKAIAEKLTMISALVCVVEELWEVTTLEAFIFSGNRYEKLSQIKISREGFKTNQ